MQDSKKDSDIKNRLLGSVGEGEGRMIWENSIETCILSYVKQIASPVLMQGAQGWCTGMTLRDRMGREVEGGVQDEENMYTHGWFMSMYGKKHYNIVK